MLRSVRMLATASLVVGGLVLAGSTTAMAGAGNPFGGRQQPIAQAAAHVGLQQRLALGAAPAVSNDDATFLGNSCASASSCVAVGFYDIPSESVAPALVENYTGTSWQADVPIPQYSAYATIANQVSCGTATTCMLVGDHYTKPTKPSMLAEISSGTTWSIVRWNNPRGMRWVVLDAVSCVGSSYCMAAGSAVKARGKEQNYTAQRRGSGALRQISTPSPAHARWAEIAGVSCLSASDCMAVGDYENLAKRVLTFAESWNGKKWRLLPATPNVKHQKQSLFNDISCATPVQCVAVGYTVGSRGVGHPFAEKWTGGKWRLSAAVSPAGAALYGVSCPAASYCMAVGARRGSGLAERWNGSSWRVLKTARTSGARSDSLDHVSCISIRHCVAVGVRYLPRRNYTNRTLAEVWNGSAWKVQSTVNP